MIRLTGHVVALLIVALITSCHHDTSKKSRDWKVKPIPLSTVSSGEPRLFSDQQNQVYLSWIEHLNDSTVALQYAQLEKSSWHSHIEIARGQNWFVNWADFPSLAKSTGTNPFFASHFLQMSGRGTYDYDVKVALSKNGLEWSTPFTLHRDSISAEHGFVSLLPLAENKILATWLDGRHTKTELAQTESETAHAHHGSMSLRVAEIREDGHLTDEFELDHRVCDCCQTDAALTSMGPVVVYRDRREDEIRDISIVRKENARWSKPVRVSADNWKIGGCPVNGPAVVANNKMVVVAWYTESNQTPKVQYAFSQDGGATFGNVIRSDDGRPMGRIDLLYHKGEVYQTWMERIEQGDAEIRMRVLSKSAAGSSKTIQGVNSARRSGFPNLASAEDGIMLAFTEVIDNDKPHVRTVLIEEDQ